MPSNWPEITLALALAFGLAYLAADLVSRLAESLLASVLSDAHVDRRLIDGPRQIVRLVLFLVVAAALSFPALAFVGYRTQFGADPDTVLRWLLNSGLRIAVIALGAYLVIRIGSAAARRFEREMSAGSGLDVIERTKRAQTLARLLQKTLSIFVTAIAALMILRELDVDITPVLTGAGIAGLAIGFGAQTLVRDVISGFFLILEDQVRVGDVAVVNGQGGFVEEVNLRTIVLRDDQGAVHIFPNGEVKTLANMTKDFSYYVITVTVGFDGDADLAIAAIRDAAAGLMQDPAFMPHILEPLDVMGVDAFEPGRLVIKSRIKTVPLKQWIVGRELRKRVAKLFTERGIKPPASEMTLRLEREERLGD